MPVIDDNAEAIAARSAARDADIIGKPPRIAAMLPEEFSDDVLEFTRNLKIAVGLPPEGPVPDFLATALRHPTLYKKNLEYAMILMSGGTLSGRDRELAVLRTGWLCRAPFEWNEHVIISKRNYGFTTAEIEQVVTGSTAPEWNDDDRTILRAVEELIGDAMISDETWGKLAARLDEKQLIELPMLVGQYMGVAFLQNSIRSPLMEGSVGLSAR